MPALPLRTLIIGAGPGGLYLAYLLKRDDPTARVTVLERNRSNDTFGFGVVFSDDTLSKLGTHDALMQRELQKATVRWEAIEIRHRGEALRAGGNAFSAIPRVRLLHLLQRLAAEAGADLRFEQDLRNLSVLAHYDLVVASDGANSGIREHWRDHFGTAEQVGKAKYAWFGSTKRYDSMTFIFEENEHGRIGAHAYPIDEHTSTFLVETDESTWRNAGFGKSGIAAETPGTSDLIAMAYLEKLFAHHLDGGRLVANNSKWRNFRTISNRTWHKGNIVLIGDAAHTAHFSVGSGTKMALEDAAALAAALRERSTIEEALVAFEAVRQPAVERVQHAGAPSLVWWERMGKAMERGIEDLAVHFLTRTPRVTLENLRMRDPRLVRRFDQMWAARHGAKPETPALATPLLLGKLSIANRLAVPVRGASFVEICAPAISGAGMVIVSADALSDWKDVVGYVHAHTPALLVARMEVSEPKAAGIAAKVADFAATGFDCLELAPDNLATAEARGFTEAVAAARAAWPEERPLSVRLPVTDGEYPVDVDYWMVAANLAIGAGASLINVAAAPNAPTSVIGDGAWRPLLVSERIRTELGVPSMIEGAIRGDDAANTAIMSGRADLCAGRPSLTSPRWTS